MEWWRTDGLMDWWNRIYWPLLVLFLATFKRLLWPQIFTKSKNFKNQHIAKSLKSWYFLTNFSATPYFFLFSQFSLPLWSFLAISFQTPLARVLVPGRGLVLSCFNWPNRLLPTDWTGPENLDHSGPSEYSLFQMSALPLAVAVCYIWHWMTRSEGKWILVLAWGFQLSSQFPSTKPRAFSFVTMSLSNTKYIHTNQ